MAGFHHFGRGGGRGRGRGQNMVMWESQYGKPPIKTRILPDPYSGFYKLHVGCVPRNWSEHTLRNAFRKVGNPASVYLNRNSEGPTNWGFVEFETFQEASGAIKELNNNVVLDGIVVSFAREKATDDVPFLDEDDDPVFDLLNEPIQPTAPIINSSRVSSEVDALAKVFSKTIINEKPLSTNIQLHNYNYVLPVCQLEDITNIENAIFERTLYILENLTPRFKCEVCGKSSNQSCGNCCIHYCSWQCQNRDWPSHSRICTPVNNTSKTNSQANGRGSDATLRQNGMTNGYKSAHESMSKFKFSSNRPEEKVSRYEDKQQVDKKNDNFRKKNKFCNDYDNGKSERGYFNRDKGRSQNEFEGSKPMFEERKSRLLSNKQIKSEAENEESWDSIGDKESSKNNIQNHNTGTTSQPSSNLLSLDRGAAKFASTNQKSPSSSISNFSVPGAGDELLPLCSVKKTEILEPVVKPTTIEVSAPTIKTEISEPVVKPTTCQVPTPTTVNNTDQTTYDLKPRTEEMVMVIHIELPEVLYVHKKEMLVEFSLLHKKLNDSTTVYTPFSPIENGLCATQYEGEWSRCQVTSLDPLTVLYIDFGNSETLTADKLFTLPDLLTVMPPFAIKIKLADGTPDKFLSLNLNDELSIKAISKMDDCWLVQVAGVPYPQTTTACSSVPDSKIIESSPVTAAPVSPKLLPAEVFTKVCVRHKEPTHLAVTPVTLLPELEKLSARIQVEADSAAPLNPAITKCLVHSQKYNHWCRGRVMQLEPLLVKLVDFGSTEICRPEHLRQITSQFSSVLPFVIYIKPNHGTVEELGKQSVFSVKPLLKDESGCWIVEVDSTERTDEMRAENINNISSATGFSVTRSDINQYLPDQTGSSTQTASPKHTLPPQLPSPTQTVAPPQQVKPTVTNNFDRDQYTTVYIMCLDEDNSEGNTYFVEKPTDVKTVSEMCTYFNSVSKDVLVSPQIGDIGLALFESVWYRVKVVSISPLKVMYIDFGNTCTLGPEELKICPVSHKDVPPLAHKVRLAPGTNQKYYNLPEMSEISIKPVSKSTDGSTVVYIEGETYSEHITPDVTESLIETQTPSQNIPETPAIVQEVQSQEPPVAGDSCQEPQYIVDLLKKDYKVQFVPNKVDPGRNLVFGTLLSLDYFPENHIIYTDMSVIMGTEPVDPNFTPREGELVACEVENDDWQRAQFLELEGKQWLSLVDHGTVIPYDSCKKIPLQYLRTPFMAAVMKLPPPVDMELLRILQVEVSVDVEVKEVATAGCVVQVYLKEREFTAEIEKWKYDPLLWPLPLSSGTLVVIVSDLDSNTFLVAPVNKDVQMLQTIQVQCDKANFKELQFHPKVGDHVVTQNEKLFWRARVKQINSDSVCTLYNIDLGSEFEASLSNLRPMPPALCKLPSKITPVVLKDVEKNTTTNKLSELGELYIKTLVKQEKPLRMDICPNLGVVTLTSVKDGQIVNERLKELLTNTILPDENGKFTLESLVHQDPPMNKELQLVVTLSDPLYVQNFDCLGKFYSEIHTPLQAHADSDSAPYNPCTNELCIVRYGGEWYRATCGKETNTGVSHVFLVDYGNILEVPTSEIRKINADFLAFPSMGLLCEIIGLPNEISPQLRSRLNEILQVESSHLGIFESKKDDKYCVNLPSVLTILKLEGLI